jgi:ADP-ribosylglycohydrolase
MKHLDPTLLQRYVAALGDDAIGSLAGRDLIRSVDTPSFVAIDSDLLADRIAGTVAGLTLGDAFAARFRRSRNDDGMDLADVHRWLGGRRPTSAGQGGHRLSAPSQVFVMSAEAILDDAYRAPRDLAATLARRVRSLRSPGNAVRHTLDNLRHGTPWFEAAPPSYGNAALPRAVAVGLALHARPEQIGIAASLDAAVSHASLQATETAAALASIVATIVTRPENVPLGDLIPRVVASIELDEVRDELEEMMAGNGMFAVPFSPEALDSLKLAVCSQQFGPDLAGILHAAATISGGDRATLAVAGALHGATFGLAGVPDRRLDVEGAQALGVLARRLAAGPGATTTVPAGDGNADIWFLLDRSGSMASIAEYVVAGFDGFFASQRAEAGDATVTVVQFDDMDRHDVIVDAKPIAKVASIGDRFEPRGMTPLYDAIALLLDRAERHGGDDADQLVVILTDGHENASREWTHQRLFRRIAKLRDRGWTFVFLGANQDSYAVGDQMAMPAGNVSNFRPDAAGVSATYAGLDRTVREWRGKQRHQRRRDADQFWGDRKEAEEL